MSNQEDPWAGFQVSLAPSDLSRVQIQNQEDLRFDLQESSPSDPSRDLLQFDDLRIEDIIIWDDLLQTTPENTQVDEGASSNQELVLPDILINLEDLGILSE
ncbi:hypothetical protein BVC80_1815g53 [Macleaya cordata]|uniref:Uncharacterized protein n=1 Tax=Macleaya cordata TaxID=56857 RepID=A0A200QVZ8_MACCD|nr:hypothetical protein BVC80_1815g53 [Macleaya cordata]